MATLGKAAGCAGAFVAGEEATIEWILQRARTYIFATATPAMVVQAARESLKMISAEGWRREQLMRLIEHLRAGTRGLRWQHPVSTTAIQPLLIGSRLIVATEGGSLYSVSPVTGRVQGGSRRFVFAAIATSGESYEKYGTDCSCDELPSHRNEPLCWRTDLTVRPTYRHC